MQGNDITCGPKSCYSLLRHAVDLHGPSTALLLRSPRPTHPIPPHSTPTPTPTHRTALQCTPKPHQHRHGRHLRHRSPSRADPAR